MTTYKLLLTTYRSPLKLSSPYTRSEHTLTQQIKSTTGDVSFLRLISTSIVAKLLIDTNTQIFSPFLPIIAAGLGIDVITMGRLLGLRSVVGLLSPFFGTLADRRGYRLVIRLGLLLTALGMLLIASSQQIWMVALGMVSAGLGVSSFIPTLQAYVSARLPYGQRARALGMVEYSWAFTGIVGLSLIGWLIEATNWRVPFFLLSIGLVMMTVVFGAMPDVRATEAFVDPKNATITPIAATPWARMRNFFALGSNALSTYSTIGAGALTFFAAFQILIIYGAWLKGQYHLDAAQLGLVALILGVFDLAASVSVSLFTDRIGKRRSVLLGNLGALAGYLLLPWLNTSISLAVLGIALARSCFEFTIVSHFPLLSEQVPTQRGKVLTLGSAIVLGAGTLASLSGPWLYTRYDVIGVSTLSMAAVCLAILLLLAWVQDPEAG
jgi:predicted MFS family arabinose efflux permease